MLITFTTATKYIDGTTIPAADLATEQTILFIDTVNPPIKNYPVPAANVAAGVAQGDGSLKVVVDAVKDLGLTLVPKATYYIAAEDSVDGVLSAETAVLTYVYTPKPASPGNFSVA